MATCLEQQVKWGTQILSYPTGIKTTNKEFGTKLPKLDPTPSILFRPESRTILGFKLTLSVPYKVEMEYKTIGPSVPIPSGVDMNELELKYPVGLNIEEFEKENQADQKQLVADAQSRYRMCLKAQETFMATCKTVKVKDASGQEKVVPVNTKTYETNQEEFKKTVAKQLAVEANGGQEPSPAELEKIIAKLEVKPAPVVMKPVISPDCKECKVKPLCC
jgi:hypothetical protein